MHPITTKGYRNNRNVDIQKLHLIQPGTKDSSFGLQHNSSLTQLLRGQNMEQITMVLAPKQVPKCCVTVLVRDIKWQCVWTDTQKILIF